MDDAAAPDGRRVPLLRWALICSVDTQIGRAEDAEARGCDKAPTATTRDRGPPTASTPFPGPVPSIRRGTLSRKRPTAQLFCPRASNRLILLVFSPSARARRRKAGAKNYRRNRKNRLEPFGDLRRLIGEQADKAGITAPIGAHAPPIPCADQRDPPGFPRPGGSVFLAGASVPFRPRASEFVCGLATPAHAPRIRTMMSSDSRCVIRAQPKPVSSLSLLMRAPDETITRCNERCDIHVGTTPRACTRRGRPEMAPPCRTPVRAFFRALLQRAVEALLQPGAIPLSYARSHPLEREMG